MKKLLFFFKRLFRMDYQRFQNSFSQIKTDSGRPTLWLLFDMLRCALYYNAGYMDYKIARMYQLNKQQRESTITRGISNEIVRRMNDKAYWPLFDNKARFNTLFAEHIGRAWLDFGEHTTEKELQDFLAQQNVILFKPMEGSSGQGIFKIERQEWENDFSSFFMRLKEKGHAILEELVVQHDALQSLNPSSVNTIRVATLLGDKMQGVVYAFIRIGNGKVIDNVDCGGMAARVDLQSGRILTKGADKLGNVFERHPFSGIDIVGFQIPYWEEVMQMCLAASRKIPQMRFIAWDVAITNKGPIFIEGNSFPSHAVPQFAAHYPDGMGILTEFRKFIDI